MKTLTNKYWFKKFFYAFRGLFSSVREEKSMIVHIILIFIIIILGIGLKINTVNWAPIILSCGFVLAIELVNTSLENLIDMVSFEYNINAQKIKDISAAATLVVALVALAVCLIIFIPRIMEIANGNY